MPLRIEIRPRNLDTLSFRKLALPSPRHPSLSLKFLWHVDEQSQPVSSSRLCLFTIAKISCHPKRSWFANEFVVKDGDIYMMLAVDPMFLLISLLEGKDNFVPLADLLETFEHEESGSEHDGFLEIFGTLYKARLGKVCDARMAGDISAFRLDDLKLTTWLKERVDVIQQTIAASEYSAIKEKIKIKDRANAGSNEHDFLGKMLAINYLRDWLCDRHFQLLLASLNIAIQAPSTKTVSGSLAHVSPTVDYSEGNPIKLASKKVKLSRTESHLAKIDKAGMRSIISFFPKQK